MPGKSATRSLNTCARPTNFRLNPTIQPNPAISSNPAELRLYYAWDSTNGSISDLQGCDVHETVRYPSGPSYQPPSPPFPNAPYPSPTELSGLASNGFAQDRHSSGGDASSFVRPYQASSFTAYQSYEYKCKCDDYPNDWTPFSGYRDIQIVRKVENRATNVWFYVISKSGSSAEMQLPTSN